MSNPSKAKGTAAEVAVVRYLNAHGYPHAERRALAGVNDRGDVSGMPGCVVEVKNCKAHQPAAWLDELAVEMRNAGAYTGVVVFKRRGTTDPAQWFALMPFGQWVDLMRDGEGDVS